MKVTDEKPKNADPTAPLPASDGEIPPWFIDHLAGGKPLSPQMQALIDDVITPLYAQLVLPQKDPVLRATGNAAVVAYAMEVLAQPDVLAAAKRALDGDAAEHEEYLKVLGSFLKVTKDRDKVMRLLLQLRKAQRIEQLHQPFPQTGEQSDNDNRSRKSPFA